MKNDENLNEFIDVLSVHRTISLTLFWSEGKFSLFSPISEKIFGKTKREKTSQFASDHSFKTLNTCFSIKKWIKLNENNLYLYCWSNLTYLHVDKIKWKLYLSHFISVKQEDDGIQDNERMCILFIKFKNIQLNIVFKNVFFIFWQCQTDCSTAGREKKNTK